MIMKLNYHHMVLGSPIPLVFAG